MTKLNRAELDRRGMGHGNVLGVGCRRVPVGVGMDLAPRWGGRTHPPRGVGLTIDPWTHRPVQQAVPYRPSMYVPAGVQHIQHLPAGANAVGIGASRQRCQWTERPLWHPGQWNEELGPGRSRWVCVTWDNRGRAPGSWVQITGVETPIPTVSRRPGTGSPAVYIYGIPNTLGNVEWQQSHNGVLSVRVPTHAQIGDTLDSIRVFFGAGSQVAVNPGPVDDIGETYMDIPLDIRVTRPAGVPGPKGFTAPPHPSPAVHRAVVARAKPKRGRAKVARFGVGAAPLAAFAKVAAVAHGAAHGAVMAAAARGGTRGGPVPLPPVPVPPSVPRPVPPGPHRPPPPGVPTAADPAAGCTWGVTVPAGQHVPAGPHCPAGSKLSGWGRVGTEQRAICCPTIAAAPSPPQPSGDSWFTGYRRRSGMGGSSESCGPGIG